jgi:hypothetical protein
VEHIGIFNKIPTLKALLYQTIGFRYLNSFNGWLCIPPAGEVEQDEDMYTGRENVFSNALFKNKI